MKTLLATAALIVSTTAAMANATDELVPLVNDVKNSCGNLYNEAFDATAAQLSAGSSSSAHVIGVWTRAAIADPIYGWFNFGPIAAYHSAVATASVSADACTKAQDALDAAQDGLNKK